MSPDRFTIPADNRILYYRRDAEMFGFLSHFHPAPIFVDGETWLTTEHYYQAQKSHDPAYRQTIREAATPGRAKRLSALPDPARPTAKQSWFRKNAALPRPDWREVKLGVMRCADLAKFTQHPELAKWLLATGDAELIEDSASEPYLGDRPRWARVKLGRTGNHGSARKAARGGCRRRRRG